MALPSKLTPKQIDAILRQGRAGYMAQQAQLTQLMRDSWPMFTKCLYELRQSVSRVNFKVEPYSEKGEEPTRSAELKADCVARSLVNFRPGRFDDEDGFAGMVFDLMDAVPNGVSVVELLWKELNDKSGIEVLPRASAWVNQNHYAFTADGRLAVTERETPVDYLSFYATQHVRQVTRESKFLVAKFKSKSGSPCAAGFMRPLAWWWVAVVYGREYALQFSQKFGGPFLDIPYQPGIPQEEVRRLEENAARAAALGYCVHPDDSQIKVTPAQAMGGDNPHVMMLRMADEACQMLMLGQTLTSAAPINGGTRAQGEVHAGVRQELIEGYAAWIGELLTNQLAESVLQENWGETTERPTITADFTETEAPQAAATRWQTIANIPGLPVRVEEIYKGIGAEQPQEGDKVRMDGKVGVFGPTEDVVNPSAADQAEAEMAQFFAPGQGFPEAGEEEGEGDVYARHLAKVRRVLSRASDEELDGIEAACVKAEEAKSAGRLNGEATELVQAVNRVAAHGRDRKVGRL